MSVIMTASWLWNEWPKISHCMKFTFTHNVFQWVHAIAIEYVTVQAKTSLVHTSNFDTLGIHNFP